MENPYCNSVVFAKGIPISLYAFGHHRPDRVTLRLGSKTSVLSLDTLLHAKSQSHGTVAAFPNGQLRKHSSAAATAAHSRKKEAFMIVFASRCSPPILFCLV